ncbi:MAG: hypothetical protein E7571_06700, partial [Ruminococcaceae bacterium]|nr:hypothetical protein [Oscillospiraceae bacterium]
YRTYGTVIGQKASGEEQALSLIYPVTSAAAMLGVTLGSLLCLVYVFIYHKLNKGILPRAGRHDTKMMQKTLLSFSFPIMLSVAVQSVFQFLDTATVQYALSAVSTPVLKSAFSESISLASAQDSDIVTYVYGLLSSALDFKNLIPGITMALGVCAVPAVSGAFEMKNREYLSLLINEVYKYTVLLAVLGSVFLSVFSRDVLDLFYRSSSPDIPVGCEQPVRDFALTIPIYCLAGSAVFCVQAIGKAEKSIAPYIVSGIIRCVLNIILVRQDEFLLTGAVISGAAGYFVLAVWNIIIVKKYSKTKFSFKNVVLKPMIIAVAMFYFLQKVFFLHETGQNLIYNLLIKIGVCTIIFCILCFLTKSLKISDIFWHQKCKKNR